MSDKRDCIKALKKAGFKLVEVNRHERWSNGSWVVAVPKGERMSPSLRRAIISSTIKPQAGVTHDHP